MTTISYARPIDRSVQIEIDGVSIEADWSMPINARGVVIFAQGSGSSRFSRRNRSVARAFYDQGFGWLLVDLLTPEEESEDMLTGALRFDVNLLSDRLLGAAKWVTKEGETDCLPVGYFGTAVGAAAALHAAARRPDMVDAVVSRGGRPDLAGVLLQKVTAPTLLIVGGADVEGLALNRWACRRLGCECKLDVIPEASHHFEEAGGLEVTTVLAAQWFNAHLASSSCVPERRSKWLPPFKSLR
jgi:putative phosphoribosyl transferase